MKPKNPQLDPGSRPSARRAFLVTGGVAGLAALAAPSAEAAGTPITTDDLDASVNALLAPTSPSVSNATLTARLAAAEGYRDAALAGVKTSTWSDDSFLAANTTILQRLIDELAADQSTDAGGGVVQLPAGNIAHTGLILRRGVTLVGRGLAITELTLKEGRDNPSITIPAKGSTRPSGVVDADGRGTGLRDLRLHGGTGRDEKKTVKSPSKPTSHGVLITPPAATWDASMSFLGGDYGITIQNVAIVGHGGDGITARVGTTAASGETRFLGVICARNNGVGFRPGPDTYIAECTAGKNVGDGFVLANGNVMIVGSKAYMNGAVNTTDTGVSIVNPAAVGFRVDGSSRNTIVGSIAQNNASEGFVLTNAGSITLQGCIADANNMRGAENVAGVLLQSTTTSIIDVASAPRGGQGAIGVLGQQHTAIALESLPDPAKPGQFLRATSANSIRLSHWSWGTKDDSSAEGAVVRDRFRHFASGAEAYLALNEIIVNGEEFSARNSVRSELTAWSTSLPAAGSMAFSSDVRIVRESPDGCEARVTWTTPDTIPSSTVFSALGSVTHAQRGFTSGQTLQLWPVQVRADLTVPASWTARPRNVYLDWSIVQIKADGTPVAGAAVKTGVVNATSGRPFVDATPLLFTVLGADAVGVAVTLTLRPWESGQGNVSNWYKGDVLGVRVVASARSHA